MLSLPLPLDRGWLRMRLWYLLHARSETPEAAASLLLDSPNRMGMAMQVHTPVVNVVVQ